MLNRPTAPPSEDPLTTVEALCPNGGMAPAVEDAAYGSMFFKDLVKMVL